MIHSPISCRIASRILQAVLLCALQLPALVGSAQPQPPRDVTTIPGTSALPRALTEQDLSRLLSRVAPTIVLLRATTDLGPGFHPRLQQGDGYAVRVLLPDDPQRPTESLHPQLITTWSWLATATQIEMWDGAAWQPVSLDYGGPTFDLARIAVAPQDTAPALEVTTRMPLDQLVFAYQPPQAPGTGPTSQGPRMQGGEHGMILSTAFGRPPGGELTYYVRGLLHQRNGLPLFDREGRVLALNSVFAPDGNGSLAIAVPHLLEWWGMRARFDGNAPGGFRPAIRQESFELQTGHDALRPQRVTPGGDTSPLPRTR